MRCAQPFMRDRYGKVHRPSELSREQRLDMTPFPCGWCLPCRINRARMWQLRIMLECKSHPVSCFVTLTYNDQNVPMNDNADLILYKPDFQNYMKRLRKRRHGERIRYFAVGEYGDKTKRPHYHVCLFGLGADDGDDIRAAWHIDGNPIGHVDIGEITIESARYIAGYCIKKLTRSCDERLHGRPPEWMQSSKRGGGIGCNEILRIAERLKQNDYFDLDHNINTFSIGGKEYPLGGYLSSKLSDALGIDPEVKEKLLSEYQEGLFLTNNIRSDNYYENIIDNSEQYRKNLNARQKIYKSKRIL